MPAGLRLKGGVIFYSAMGFAVKSGSNTGEPIGGFLTLVGAEPAGAGKVVAEFAEADDCCSKLTAVMLDPHPAGNLGFLGGATDLPVAVGCLSSPMVGMADDTVA